MGFRIIQLLVSAFVISLFFGVAWNVIRGFIDGYNDANEKNNKEE